MMYVCGFVALLCVSFAKCDWVANNGIWYYISPDEEEGLDYLKASAKCASMNAHLAVITNEDQNNFLARLFNDEKYHWIGMSNIRTENHRQQCDDTNWFWNTDITCDNIYRGFEYRYVLPTDEGCLGVVLGKWRWVAGACSEKHGYICQWECKRLLLHLDSRPHYSGEYNFDQYYKENFVYVKKVADGYTILLKSDKFKQWVVLEELENLEYHYEAISNASSYVPYGKSVSFVTNQGAKIISSLICIDCSKFSVLLHPERVNLTLTTDGIDFGSQPEVLYVSTDNKFGLIPLGNYRMCFHELSEDKILRLNCADIFPYPQKTTTFTLTDSSELTFTNLCWNSLTVPNDSDASLLDNQMTIIIVVSVVASVAIIIAIIISIVVVLWRKKQKQGHNLYYNVTVGSVEYDSRNVEFREKAGESYPTNSKQHNGIPYRVSENNRYSREATSGEFEDIYQQIEDNEVVTFRKDIATYTGVIPVPKPTPSVYESLKPVGENK